ncbi:MAG: hypothetical protein NZ699_17980 [Roseiflexus sp.]|nr:hypothetical protein [Roseiflexus sp.]MCS7291014.1 hypothetical protein [Roseiflexus sp.]MDW8147476.1 hypothetical protein [Roseiflexaceae bacterium]MDW8233432.1 hypothetical protein [Roseiflexaceae bacterium]
MDGLFLFVLFAAFLLLAAHLVWRYWAVLTTVSPEEERLEKRLAALNEHQAHRYSDEELAAPISEEDAWRLMVERGRRIAQRERSTDNRPRHCTGRCLTDRPPRLLLDRRTAVPPSDDE